MLEQKVVKKKKKNMKIIMIIALLQFAFPLAFIFFLIQFATGDGGSTTQQIITFKVPAELLRESHKLCEPHKGGIDWIELVTYGFIESEDEVDTEVLNIGYDNLVKGNQIVGYENKEISEIFHNVLKELVGEYDVYVQKEIEVEPPPPPPKTDSKGDSKAGEKAGSTTQNNTSNTKTQSSSVSQTSNTNGNTTGSTEKKTDSKSSTQKKDDSKSKKKETQIITVIEKRWGKKAYFPIAFGYTYQHVDGYGDSRSYGGDREHEGNDIMAATGTPIISVEDGIIENIGWNELGGYRIGIRSTDGYRYFYYAHMDHYAAGMISGLSVRAGDVIGYVGDTGYGPEGTRGKFEPHLHFGIQFRHYGSEEWLDPYSILDFIKDKQMPVTQTTDGGYVRTQ